MKLLIASDLHGSAYYAEKIVNVLNQINADKLILLGDVYNHGPRNPLPQGYETMSVSEILNNIKDKLVVVKGNCDSEVDKMISEFDFLDNATIIENGKTVFLTHGHIYNKDNMPKTRFDAVIYGHFHTGFIERQDGAIVANAGSLSLPKNNTPSSYLVLENGILKLFNINGSLIKEEKI